MVNDVLTYIVSAILYVLLVLITIGYKKQHALVKGLQALLRDRLYEIYFRCMAKGYATNVEKNKGIKKAILDGKTTFNAEVLGENKRKITLRISISNITR